MTFPWQPDFHYLNVRALLFETVQQVVLTDTGAKRFNEEYGTTCFEMGTVIGHLHQVEGNFDVYNKTVQYLGKVESKVRALEELVKLYARQHTQS